MERDRCYRAVRARDRRFDGVFFTCVETTGIYCRPICPARLPGKDRCEFVRTAAQAERAGFRACLRCRPELAPGNASVDAKARCVRVALQRIQGGYLNQHSVEDLAVLVGVSARHLRRSMESELGVSPVELAQTQRLSLAKQLLQDTDISLANLAMASGFGSVRRFNAVFATHFGRAPSAIRRRSVPESGSVTIRLEYRPPLEWPTMLAYLRARSIPGVESVDEESYARTVKLNGIPGWIEVRAVADKPALCATLSLNLVPCLSRVVPKLRSLFDLDARPDLVAAHLQDDAILRPSLQRLPGLRVPGTFDPFELGVRAILGQQISVAGATTLSGRFAHSFGEVLDQSTPRLNNVFPSASKVATLSLSKVRAIGLPERRAATILAFAKATSEGTFDSAGAHDASEVIKRIQELPGIGPWTAQYYAMRALSWPDAFPAGDLGLRKALGVKTASQASSKSAAWSPWRAYGAMHLWQSGVSHRTPNT